MSRVKKNENLHIKINRWMRIHERSHPTDKKYEKMKGVSNGKVGEMERTKIVISFSMLCHWRNWRTLGSYLHVSLGKPRKEKTLSLILKIAISTYATSISIPTPPMCPKNSTAVTCEPSLDQTEPLKTNQ